MKWVAWGFGIGFLIFVVVGLLTLLPLKNQNPERARDTEQKRQNAEMEEFRKKFKQPGEPALKDYVPVVTKADFDAIQPGMSYAQVSGMIRSSGEELSRVDLAGHTTIMYSWKNADGSNMNAMFQNDALVSKAQFGLR